MQDRIITTTMAAMSFEKDDGEDGKEFAERRKEDIEVRKMEVRDNAARKKKVQMLIKRGNLKVMIEESGHKLLPMRKYIRTKKGVEKTRLDWKCTLCMGRRSDSQLENYMYAGKCPLKNLGESTGDGNDGKDIQTQDHGLFLPDGVPEGSVPLAHEHLGHQPGGSAGAEVRLAHFDLEHVDHQLDQEHDDAHDVEQQAMEAPVCGAEQEPVSHGHNVEQAQPEVAQSSTPPQPVETARERLNRLREGLRAKAEARILRRSQFAFGGGELHHTHRLHHKRGLVWCWNCGAMTSDVARKLTEKCDIEPTRGGEGFLRRLRQGKTPRTDFEWPMLPGQGLPEGPVREG